MKKVFTYILLILAAQLSLLSCSDDKVDGAVFALKSGTEEVSQLSFAYGEAYVLLALSSNTDWTLTSDQSWCELSNVGGTPTEVQYIKLTVAYNTSEQSRTATLTFNAGGNIKRYQVVQASKNGTTCPAGMEQDAIDVVKSIYMGWNLGNTLEAIGGETAWGNPVTTREMIEGVKAKGFNAVRIPCSWDQYLDENGRIQESWMNHVKEVVDYCIDNDMYVILNTHHEDWLESHPFESEAETILTKERNLWRAIATFFKDYDERLIFSGTNEVEDNWKAPTTENLKVQNSFNQCFVDAVRSTGGKNYYRNLIVQTYATNPDYALPGYENGGLTFPTDVVENRIAIEFHYYRPAGFSYMDFADYTETVYYWGKDYIQYNKPGASNEQEDYVDWLFAKIKQEWVDKGYPVVMGEYGVVTPPKDKSNGNNNDLADTKKYYMKYITSAAKKNGIVPIVWDNGTFYNPLYGQSFEEGKEFFGLFNRWYEMQLNIYTQPILDGIMEGANTEYPY